MARKQKPYRIAEFAKMVGIEPSTVRYYEKQGLTGTRRGNNGYRVFDETDAYRMNTFRSINTRGFSIGEALNLLDNPPRRTIIQCLREKLQDMEWEQILMEARRQWTEETLNLLEQRDAGRPMLWRTQLEDFYYLPASIKGDFSVTQENGAVRSFWQERLPLTRFVGIANGETLVKGEPAFIDYGESVPVSIFEKYNYMAHPSMRRILMGDCVCFFFVGFDMNCLCLANHPEVTAYLEENQLDAAGELLLFFLMLNIEEDGEDSGIAALPVKRRET